MAKKKAVVEQRAIDFVSDEERHGSVYSMATLFYSVNMQITAVAIGVIPIALGLSIGWSILAIILGNLLGGIVMALHAVQGPRIGIPQMIQSRAQFGVLGANVPLILVVIMYLGYFAGTSILGAQALTGIFGMPTVWAIIVSNILAFALFFIGHDGIHRFAKVASVAFGVMFIIATVLAIKGVVSQPVSMSSGGFSLPVFVAALAIYVGWQITFGPYVADYSRYLPKETDSRLIFGVTYLGSVVGASWAMCVGVLLGVISGTFASANPTVAFSNLFGAADWIHVVILLLVLAGAVIINAVNLYGGCLSSLSILGSNSALSESAQRHGKYYRIGIGVVGIILGTIISTAGADSVMGYLNHLLLILGYVFIPWSAVNLTDFFLVRHGEYSAADIHDKHGQYGAWRAPALIAFVLAFGLEIPFISLPFFEGPIASALGSTDIAWIVGLVVGCVTYYGLETRRHRHTGS